MTSLSGEGGRLSEQAPARLLRTGNWEQVSFLSLSVTPTVVADAQQRLRHDRTVQNKQSRTVREDLWGTVREEDSQVLKLRHGHLSQF